MLFLQWKTQVPHYFFRKKWSASFFSPENSWVHRYFYRKKNKAPHYFFRKNGAPPYFFRKKSSTKLFLQKKMFFFRKKETPHFYSEEIVRCFIFFWRNFEAPHFCLWRTNEAPHVFLKKAWGTWACCLNILADVISAVTKSSASVFLQKKIKRLIISSEKMLVFFFEENMIHLIFVLQK